MKYKFVFVLLLTINAFCIAQKKNLLLRLLRNNPQYFSDILAAPEKYEVQIIYTQINRDIHNGKWFWDKNVTFA